MLVEDGMRMITASAWPKHQAILQNEATTLMVVAGRSIDITITELLFEEKCMICIRYSALVVWCISVWMFHWDFAFWEAHYMDIWCSFGIV